MKTRVPLYFIIAATFLACSGDPGTIKVVSFNIRYDNPSDGINAWSERKEMVAGFIRNENPDLFGLQEALWHQYTFIDSSLDGYGSVATGRDDGLKGGEMTPIFYRRELFNLEESGTFWLSDTPGVPGSRGWGAALPRIVTWACLRKQKDGDRLYYFNTHFSHMSDSARIMSSKVLRKEVARIAGESPFIITGDFNMVPDSRAYAELVELPVIDSYYVEGVVNEGAEYTFNGFSDNPGSRRIDYIFVKTGLEPVGYTTRVVIHDKVFISDHWPVIVTLKDVNYK
ncbi:MAG: endonuclease/exonuclease/phosphatase family protein [Bacteroidia bacterium]|nr:MAG: endonuclease/exonuclease/phosphatase family protein [Bacteroidia bacterium]